MNLLDALHEIRIKCPKHSEIIDQITLIAEEDIGEFQKELVSLGYGYLTHDGIHHAVITHFGDIKAKMKSPHEINARQEIKLMKHMEETIPKGNETWTE